MARVSVIVPNYNHARFLNQRISSILEQSFQDFEVIILDDASKDGSQEYLMKFKGHPKVKELVFNKVNSGSVFKQWKKGISRCTGDYIWIAESDDWAEPSFLETLMNLVEKDPAIGIAFCDSNWVDDKGVLGKSLSIHKQDFCIPGHQEIVSRLLKYNTIQNASSAVIRRDLAVQYIDQVDKFKSCGDWFFYLSVLQKSNLAFTSKRLNNFRWYHENTSNKASRSGLWIKEAAMIFRMAKPVKLTSAERNDIAKYWDGILEGYKYRSTITLFLLFKFSLYFFLFRSFFK